MPTFQPKPYQADAIRKLRTGMLSLLGIAEHQDRRLKFQAPTGAGKTLMLGYALAEAHNEPGGSPFIVLWLSPGRGDLHKQSANSLSRMLADTNLVVELLDTRDDIIAHSDPTSGTVFVVNWEKLRTQTDGEWSNRMLKEGETANLFTLLENTSAAGLDMVVVVDESHTNLQAQQTTKLMDAIRAFRPFIQVEASATPTMALDEELREEGVHRAVTVPFRKVQAEGMVRKSVLLNPEFEAVQRAHPEESLDRQVLHAAWERVASLQAGYDAVGSPVRPLLLIQYPDGREAKARAAVVEDFLARKGLVRDETFAVWLSGDHSDGLAAISRYSSPYRALVFKQAIAMGWDCPRAQVLVQFRKPGSDTFQIQTLGRILRSPEQRHYSDESLNVAYVYSDLAGVSVRISSDEPNVPLQDLALRRSDAYPAEGLRLKSTFQPRRRDYHYPKASHLLPALTDALDRHIGGNLPEVPFSSTTVAVLADGELSIEALMKESSSEFEGDSVRGELGEGLVQALFDRALVRRIGAYLSPEQSRSRIKTILIRWFLGRRPRWRPDEIQHFVLRNAPAVSAAIDAACHESMKSDTEAAVSSARSKRRTTTTWEIPETQLVSGTDSVPAAGSGCIYTPAMVSKLRSRPEERFERWLGERHRAAEVVWWWKNGTRDEKCLGVEYPAEVGNVDGLIDELCYPDYLVLDASNKLWVLEVKDMGDRDGAVDGPTCRKAAGMQTWAEHHNQRRQEMPDLLEVAALVVVPTADGHAGVRVQYADPGAWTEPSRANLSTGTGWTDLILGTG